MKNPLEKFKHRNIAKVATAYAVVGWLMLQLTEIVLPTFNAPQWIAQTIIFVVIMGFPIAILIAWASEVRSNGDISSSEGSVSNSETMGTIKPQVPKRLFYGVGAASIFTIGIFAFYVSTTLFEIQTSISISESEFVSRTNFRSKRSVIPLGELGRTFYGTTTDIAISPDGNLLAYLDSKESSQTAKLMLKDLRYFDEQRNLGEITFQQGYGNLQFTHDGEWIHFFDRGILNRVRVEGGPFQAISGTSDSQSIGHLVVDGNQYFISDEDWQINKIALGEGAQIAEPMTSGDFVYAFPTVLPGGKHWLVSVMRLEEKQLVTGNSAAFDIAVLNTDDWTAEVIVNAGHNSRYVSSGHIVFMRDSDLWAVPFDASELKLKGPQIPVVQNVQNQSNQGFSVYTVSNSGGLFYLEGRDVSASSESWIEKVTRSGDSIRLDLPSGDYGNLSLSPDEKNLAFTSYTAGSSDIWIWNLEQEILGRLTFTEDASWPIWSASGSEIIYQRLGEEIGLWAVAADGTGEAERILTTPEPPYPFSLDNEDSIIFYMGTPPSLYTTSSPEERVAEKIELTAASTAIRHGQVSADGKWLAYASWESGMPGVFVRPWPNYRDGKWQASRGRAMTSPLWNESSSELFMWDRGLGQQTSTKFDVITDASTKNSSIRFRESTPLFDYKTSQNIVRVPSWAYSSQLDVFYVIVEPSNDESVGNIETNIHWIEDWANELESKVIREE